MGRLVEICCFSWISLRSHQQSPTGVLSDSLLNSTFQVWPLTMFVGPFWGRIPSTAHPLKMGGAFGFSMPYIAQTHMNKTPSKMMYSHPSPPKNIRFECIYIYVYIDILYILNICICYIYICTFIYIYSKPWLLQGTKPKPNSSSSGIILGSAAWRCGSITAHSFPLSSQIHMPSSTQAQCNKLNDYTFSLEVTLTTCR